MADAPRVLSIPLHHPAELYKNYAEDQAVAERAKTLVTEMIARVRRNRQQMDRLAMRRYNQWAMKVDDRFYVGRANSYIPAVRKGVEKLVTTWIRETFPNDQWWDVRPTASEFAKNIDGQKALMTVQLQRRMKVKRRCRPAYRQLALYGSSPVKVPWHSEQRTEVTVAVEDGQPVVKKETKTLYDDPDFRPIDFFSFGVYPMTVMDVDDAKLVYEDMIVEVAEVERDTTNYANIEAAKQGAGGGTTGSQAFQYRKQRLQELGITEDETSDKDFLFLTECYTQFDFEDQWQLGLEPAIITLAWGETVVRVQRNPYRRPPYFVFKDLEMISEFFAHARTEATDRLQIILNDIVNQDLDAAAFANNPVCTYDPNEVEDAQAIAIYPGAKIPVPSMKFDRPPEAAFSQKEKAAFFNQMILDMLGAPSGVSPSPAASGTSRGARTFGGMQMLMASANSEAKEVVEFQEDAVWEPMLQWMAWLNATFMSDDRTLQTAGKDGVPVTVSRETFQGDYAYEWMGTTTVQNQTMRSAGLLVFANVAPKMPMPPGTMINGPHILKEWWRDQGFKDADQVVMTMGQQEMVPPQVENKLIEMNRAVEVAMGDNDPEHISVHSQDRMKYPPDDPRHAALLTHEQAHFHQYAMKQSLAARPPMGAPPGAPPGAGRPVTGAQPPGSRAGGSPEMGPQSGFGPARAIANAPVAL